MLPERELDELIGHIPEIDWWCKLPRRGPRKRRIPLCMDRGWFLGNHFGDNSCPRDAPSGSDGRRPTRHWDPEEVNRLIAGVEKYGQSKWHMITREYFPDPDQTQRARTPGDLKDKWRNLRKPCQGDVQTRCYNPLKSRQIKRIKKILGIRDE
uniref:Myb-like domain-containing protein n=1 Tax=Hordeum vulgare subsp. vulgare TaxID=112509 RepID=A0A8I6WQK7_HORVV